MAKMKNPGPTNAANAAKSAPMVTPVDTVDHSQPEDLLEGTASGLPATRADRLAFTVWIVMFLLLIGFTLVTYLINWFVR